MPGPIYVPGAKLPRIAPPPKPVAKPWITTPDLPNVPLVAIPPEPLAAWRSLWHAIGSNLPWYVNHSRASRRAMNGMLRTHG